MLHSDWHRFGYACVNFGTPVSMREYCRTRGIDFQALSGEERARSAWPQLGTRPDGRPSAASCRCCRCR